ncbi:MAG: MGMT family protein [Patescibacteria group bacterium]|nr:MGMT family protein [Patescibacteria group bacterium]MCL5431874.1 MGMT family protein [Patescibacteria group bacterium]
MNCFSRIYEITREIPAGKVSTYGRVAKIVGTTPRVVGFALHANRDPKTPCHRVVDRHGRLAPNFAFGGVREQYLKLNDEGIKFLDETHVDLDKYLIG